MKILILGGTGFVGRILTENLIKSGEQPVLFNRGKRNPGIFPELRKISGDRESIEINLISSEDWDAVVDFSGQFPDNVEMITELLRGKAGRYIFVSSASVYVMEDEEKHKQPIKEDFPIYPCTPGQRIDRDIMATYSQKKSECERVLLNASGWLDVIIFRPALIYGRYDPTDRFYYWLYRAKYSGEVLIPDEGSTRTTSTYSEDFALLIQEALTIKEHKSVYNAVTHSPVSLNEIITKSSELLGTKPELVSAPGEYFAENNVLPWADIPLWLGGADLVLDNSRVLMDFDIRFRSFGDSIKGCIEYYSSMKWQVPGYGLSIEKEKELLKKFKK